ncbi:reverse transcriptase N-terminal domain-containing protein [Vibrio antiquarius]
MISSHEVSAPSGSAQWQSIDWKAVERHVLRLQMRIAKAIREGKHGKAKALQWILTNSKAAKLHHLILGSAIGFFTNLA